MSTCKHDNTPDGPKTGSDAANANPTSKPNRPAVPTPSQVAMDELVRMSEEMGLYQNPSPPPVKDVFRRKS